MMSGGDGRRKEQERRATEVRSESEKRRERWVGRENSRLAVAPLPRGAYGRVGTEARKGQRWRQQQRRLAPRKVLLARALVDFTCRAEARALWHIGRMPPDARSMAPLGMQGQGNRHMHADAESEL